MDKIAVLYYNDKQFEGTMDIVNGKTRSKMMASVRSKNTMIEVEIRRRLFAKGYRFRLHSNGLPGKPDIVFPKYSAVIFINGCFWHNHGCPRSKLPQTRRQWWKAKLEGNRRHDEEVIFKLKDMRWRIIIVWECCVRRAGIRQVDALDKIANRIITFLGSKRRILEIPISLDQS